MTTEQFRTALKARPFQPFVIKTAGGDEYPVSHPEMAAQLGTGRTVVVEVPGDAVTILDLLLVEGLRFSTADRAGAQQ